MKKSVKRSHGHHRDHPGIKQDHQTLFIFWVISAILLIIVVALIRASG